MKTWCVIAFSLATIAVSAQQHEHPAAALDKLGKVSFPNSCNAAAQVPFNRGIALVHSFEFSRAIDALEATLKADPTCGIAAWGIALSHWSNPFAANNRPPPQIKRGMDAVDRARAAGTKTPRERGSSMPSPSSTPAPTREISGRASLRTAMRWPTSPRRIPRISRRRSSTRSR